MTTDPAFVATTRTFYDAVAEDYHARFRTVLDDAPLDRALMGAFAELVGPGGQVADLGCGTGTLSILLANEGGHAVTGVDFSPEMIRRALRLSGGNRAQAARSLGIHRQLLHAKLARYGIEAAGKRAGGDEDGDA